MRRSRLAGPPGRVHSSPGPVDSSEVAFQLRLRRLLAINAPVLLAGTAGSGKSALLSASDGQGFGSSHGTSSMTQSGCRGICKAYARHIMEISYQQNPTVVDSEILFMAFGNSDGFAEEMSQAMHSVSLHELGRVQAARTDARTGANICDKASPCIPRKS